MSDNNIDNNNVDTVRDEQEWIESPDGWNDPTTASINDDDDDDDEETAMNFLFANDNNNNNKDPSDVFSFVMSPTSDTIHLEGYQLDSDETARSTGVTLWGAAPQLAQYLVDHADRVIRGRRVVELGAGLGLCGIVAHRLGASRVLLTDGDTHALRQMRVNVQKNCVGMKNNDNKEEEQTIHCQQLLWGNPTANDNKEKDTTTTLSSLSYANAFREQHGRFDVVLGADVVYTEASLGPLLDTVSALLRLDDVNDNSDRGQFVLSRQTRWNNVADETVLEAAAQRNLECTGEPTKGIFVFQWKKK